MNLLEISQKYLRQAEGWKSHVYPCSEGVLTIGCGRNVDKAHGGPGLRDCEIAFMLQNDIEAAIADLRHALDFFDSLTVPRQLVLVSMRFQLGLYGLLSFQLTLQAIKREEYELAAAHMRNSLAYKQTPERWRVLAAIMSTGRLPEALG